MWQIMSFNDWTSNVYVQSTDVLLYERIDTQDAKQAILLHNDLVLEDYADSDDYDPEYDPEVEE